MFICRPSNNCTPRWNATPVNFQYHFTISLCFKSALFLESWSSARNKTDTYDCTFCSHSKTCHNEALRLWHPRNSHWSFYTWNHSSIALQGHNRNWWYSTGNFQRFFQLQCIFELVQNEHKFSVIIFIILSTCNPQILKTYEHSQLLLHQNSNHFYHGMLHCMNSGISCCEVIYEIRHSDHSQGHCNMHVVIPTSAQVLGPVQNN